MNRRYEDIEREDGRVRYGVRPNRLRVEQYRGRDDAGGAWDWPDRVWSGQGRFDEGSIAEGRFRHVSRPYTPSAFGRRAYGSDRYGWIEYDEPRYVGSLYRGERRGEEPYREHEWRRTKERPGLLARLYARGPKGYTRSDERINEDISEKLWQADHVDSSEVTIAVEDAIVTLTGSVPERWMRHEIEDIADSCMGVKDIVNNVRVLRRRPEGADVEPSGPGGRPEGASSGTATPRASAATAKGTLDISGNPRSK